MSAERPWRIEIEVDDTPHAREQGNVGAWRDSLATYASEQEAQHVVEVMLLQGVNARVKAPQDNPTDTTDQRGQAQGDQTGTGTT